MTETYLLNTLILVPIICGILCFLIRHSFLRSLIIGLTALLLIAGSIVLLMHGPFEYTPADFWSKAIVGIDFALLLYFLFLGFANRSLLVILLALLQIVPLGYFEFIQKAHVEVNPAFVIDQLAIIMCLVVSIIGSVIAIYAIKYMADHEHHLKMVKSRQPVFFLYFVLFLGAMNGLVFSNNLLWLYFFWEVTTLCCYQLIRHDLNAESKANALRALWMNLIGGVAFAFAAIWLFNHGYSLAISEIVKSSNATLIMIPVGLLCLAGFTKSAQVPFQRWLLGAMVAPTPVSALLHSSTMVNAGVYLLIRFAPAFKGTNLSTMVMLVGAFSFLATAIIALTQGNAKKLLAYSTIGNLGLIVMCAGINTPLTITAALILLVFHAVSKGLLFMCVGTIESIIHSREIENMAELITRLPWLTAVTIIGILTMFLAPFGLLVGKWATMEGIMSNFSTWSFIAAIMLLIGSAATTVFWTKYLGRLINKPVSLPRAPVDSISFLYKLPLTTLVLLAIILGIIIAPFYDFIIQPAVNANYNSVFNTSNGNLIGSTGSFTSWPLFILMGAVLLMPLLILRSRKEDMVPVYMCGENASLEKCEFCTVADKYEPMQTSGLYFTELFDEPFLEKLFTPVGILILLVLFGLLL